MLNLAVVCNDKNPILMKIIFYLVISLIYWYINFKINGPVLCDTLSHVEKLQSGIIHRTPLLQAGQTIRDLPHGI